MVAIYLEITWLKSAEITNSKAHSQVKTRSLLKGENMLGGEMFSN